MAEDPAREAREADRLALDLTEEAGDDCVSVAFYPGEEGAVGSVSPWFCGEASARLLFGGDSCADCGDDLTDPEAADPHVCEGDGPTTVWFYLKPEAETSPEALAAWLDVGDPYKSAGRVAALEAAVARLKA